MADGDRVDIILPDPASSRVEFGAQKLSDALVEAGYDVNTRSSSTSVQGISRIVLGVAGPRGAQNRQSPEGYRLLRRTESEYRVTGFGDSGVLYGCLDLAQRVAEAGALPADLDVIESPAFRLRGPCIGMQKTYILPGRRIYEYPYTPELFPFFYDKEHWREFLDFLVSNRMNTLYLWNGHPFASLVRVPEYPYAVEVTDDVFEQNVAMLHWITEECDKRGIWLVQMFYSLLVSQPFAEHFGIETQLGEPTPEALDYTRKSIAQFVKEYPNVGLLVCLGEALQGVENQSRFLTDTVLAGVRDGMEAAGLKEPPPVVVRAHATDPDVVMPAAFKVYQNIYTMAKYNGESLTTWEPRGEWQRRHLAMSALTSNHVVNVHILANLEPFRYGAQRFIRKCVQASRDRLGATAIHLYPLFYWDWPESPDIAEPRLSQWDRDWIWFEAWARYAWNPDVSEAEDRAYWIARLTEMYGDREAAARILAAYNDAGECAPRLLRRFGITEGNRQTLSLGMTLDQLVNPEKYRPWPDLWNCQAPPGERLDEYARKEWNHEPHEGETPPQIIREALEYSSSAVTTIEAAAPLVTTSRDEFERLRNDVHCIRAMTEHYAGKVEAAMHVLRYQYSHDVADMEKAVSPMEESLVAFRRLAALTEDTYAAANSLQTGHRKIPFPGAVDGVRANYHWVQALPLYEKELVDFRAHVSALKHSETARSEADATGKAVPK